MNKERKDYLKCVIEFFGCVVIILFLLYVVCFITPKVFPYNNDLKDERLDREETIIKPINIQPLDDVVLISKVKEVNSNIIEWEMRFDGEIIFAKIKGIVGVREGGDISIKNSDGKVWNFNVDYICYSSRYDFTIMHLKVDDHLKNQIKEIENKGV